MRLNSLLGLAGMVLASSLAACMAAPDEGVGGGAGAATSSAGEFKRNTVLADSALKDSEALSVDDIQGFLEKTPWNKRSVLADYKEDGKSAAEIISAVSSKYGINPLELLVRAQMEQGLIYKTSASDESIEIAFGCGCPHSPVCSDKYMGFANQAECAAGTLSRSMDKATTTTGTASGWRVGTEKASEDGLTIKPSNAATAALYTYTPWVGEAGGGRKGVGGASLHFQTWNRFADAIGYGVEKTAEQPQGTSSSSSGGADADAGSTDPGTSSGDTGTGSSSGDTGTGSSSGDTGTGSSSGDTGTGSSSSGGTTADAGTTGDAGTSTGAGGDGTSGEDDSDILSGGNAPPSTNAPPPRGSSSSRSSSVSDSDESEASDADLAAKKKAQDGCSTTGGSGSTGNGLLIGLAVALVAAGKRRRSA